MRNPATDEHRSTQIKKIKDLSVFIGVHLWLGFDFSKPVEQVFYACDRPR